MGYWSRPQSVFLRRALFQVHLWAGLIAGLYILLMCCTGAALVFRIDLQRASYPALFTPLSAGPLAHPAVVLDSVRKAFPAYHLAGVDAPTNLRPTYLAYVTRGAEFRTILLDPSSGRVLGELPVKSSVQVLQELHFELLAGRTGTIVNGFGALSFLLLALTGAAAWWQGADRWRRGLVINRKGNPPRIAWQLHSATGFWAFALLVMWGLTGIFFTFPEKFRTGLSYISSISVSQSVRLPDAVPDAPPLDAYALVERARRVAPASYVARVVLPLDAHAPYQVLFARHQPTHAGEKLFPVYVHPVSGAIIPTPPDAQRTFADLVLEWAGPLHTGSFGGPVLKILWALFALLPPMLFVTGLISWWNRVVKPWRARQQAGSG